MGRKHAFVVAVLFAVAAVGGAYATMQTLDLGAAAASAPTAVAGDAIGAREKKLNRWEQALRKAARKHPPKLPEIPKFAPVAIPEVPPLDLGSAGSAALPQQPPSPPTKSKPKPAAPKTPSAKPPEAAQEPAAEPPTEAAPPPAATIPPGPDPIINYAPANGTPSGGGGHTEAEAEVEGE